MMKMLFTLFLYFGILNPYGPICGCDESNSIQTEIEQSDLVISGLVLSKAIISRSERGSDYKKHKLVLIRYEVEVLKIYKSIASHKKLFLYSLRDSASCGLNLDTNQRYIVFAKKGTYVPSDSQDILSTVEKKGYWVNTCSKTAPFKAEMEVDIEKNLTG